MGHKTNHEKMTMFDRRVYRQSLRYKCEISYTASFICIVDMVGIWYRYIAKWRSYKRFTDIGCKSVVIVPKEAALRLPFRRTLWRGGEGVMRERTLRTLPFNGVNWVASLK